MADHSTNRSGRSSITLIVTGLALGLIGAGAGFLLADASLAQFSGAAWLNLIFLALMIWMIAAEWRARTKK